jgi:CRP-like cAMP-binding protein
MKDSPELRAAIRAASAFRDLSDASLAVLIEAAEPKSFDAGAILMLQGEPSDYAMLILAGQVTVTADSTRGAIRFRPIMRPR